MRISVIGHFGTGLNLLNGQTIKTKIVTEELERRFGLDEVLKIDTHGGFKTLLCAPFKALSALKNSKNVIIFPAHNGVRVYAPLLAFLKRFFKERKIHYVVIGGWLPQFLQNKKYLSKSLKKFDGIYVETNTMKAALERQGFSNVYVMPNCKKLHIVSEEELVYNIAEPYKLCTFSRVMQEKGIEDAVNSVISVNEQLGRTVYTLDIYGPVDQNQTEWFDKLQNSFPEYIKYKGVIESSKSVEVLKDYFALLFPTHYYTEGIPGTVIDAYAAGVPVIASKWESFSDLIDDGITGIGYSFDNTDELTKLLLCIAEQPQIILNLKRACVANAEKFTPETVVDILVRGGVKNNVFDIQQIKGILLLSLKCDIRSDEVSFVSPLLKLCTFSRVSKEKGIEDAVQAVNMANAVIGHTVFALDIYGKIDDDQSEWFKSIIKNFPSNIRYNGTVAFNESTNTIKNYFALLFPTYYDGEGFAGTLIDALAAGVPVVASDWRYNNELVSENVTGVLFRTHNLNAFAERLVWIYNNQEKWNGLKINCVCRARDFIPENAVEVLLDKLIN